MVVTSHLTRGIKGGNFSYISYGKVEGAAVVMISVLSEARNSYRCTRRKLGDNSRGRGQLHENSGGKGEGNYTTVGGQGRGQLHEDSGVATQEGGDSCARRKVGGNSGGRGQLQE